MDVGDSPGTGEVRDSLGVGRMRDGVCAGSFEVDVAPVGLSAAAGRGD